MKSNLYGIGRTPGAKGLHQVRIGSVYRIIKGSYFTHGILMDIKDDDLVFLLENGNTTIYHDSEIELRRSLNVTNESKEILREAFLITRKLSGVFDMIEDLEKEKNELYTKLEETKQKIKETY